MNNSPTLKHPLIRRYKFFLLVLGAFTFAEIRAQGLVIDITGGVESTMPVAIVPFAWTGQTNQAPINVSSVVKSDLSLSGYFNLLPERNMLTRPTHADKVKFRNWQALGQEFLVIGQIKEVQGQYAIQFQLFDVYKEEQIFAYRMNFAKQELRRAAHSISNFVLQKLTGIRGVFDSKIAYITSVVQPNRQILYKLQVADADGFNPITIAASKEPLMSPVWSPDAKKIAYVSFEKKSSAIFIQTLATGERVKISSHPGINGAPAWSPDGKRMAMTLSKDGSPDIYVLNLINRNLQKLTKSFAIDTEPSWSPDGRYIVFTSDRGGKPQLYKMPSSGGRAERLTFQGDYNARGRFSQDGKKLAMVHGNRGDYRIAVMDIKTKTVSALTSGRQDESPSFAPNSNLLVYAAIRGNKRMLSVVSVDGRMQQKLIFDRGEIREPAWSP